MDCIEVRRLTPELVETHRRQAYVALNGEGCDLRSMRKSCFAVENCGNGGRGIELGKLLDSNAFVAVDEADPTKPAFVGCICAKICPNYIRTLFPHNKQPSGLMVFTFCVAEEYREKRVGKRLMEEMFKLSERSALPLYLCVAVAPPNGDPDCMHEYEYRVPRLFKTYGRMNFSHVCDCDLYSLFRWKGRT